MVPYWLVMSPRLDGAEVDTCELTSLGIVPFSGLREEFGPLLAQTDPFTRYSSSSSSIF